MCLKITYLNFHSNFLGANELILVLSHYGLLIGLCLYMYTWGREASMSSAGGVAALSFVLSPHINAVWQYHSDSKLVLYIYGLWQSHEPVSVLKMIWLSLVSCHGCSVAASIWFQASSGPPWPVAESWPCPVSSRWSYCRWCPAIRGPYCSLDSGNAWLSWLFSGPFTVS